LPVDNRAGSRLVEINGLGRVFRPPEGLGFLSGRRLLCRHLKHCQLFRKSKFGVLSFLGELLPSGSLRRFPSRAIFGTFAARVAVSASERASSAALWCSASCDRRSSSSFRSDVVASSGSGGGTKGPALKSGRLPKLLWNQIASWGATLSVVKAWL